MIQLCLLVGKIVVDDFVLVGRIDWYLVKPVLKIVTSAAKRRPPGGSRRRCVPGRGSRPKDNPQFGGLTLAFELLFPNSPKSSIFSFTSTDCVQSLASGSCPCDWHVKSWLNNPWNKCGVPSKWLNFKFQRSKMYFEIAFLFSIVGILQKNCLYRRIFLMKLKEIILNYKQWPTLMQNDRMLDYAITRMFCSLMKLTCIFCIFL